MSNNKYLQIRIFDEDKLLLEAEAKKFRLPLSSFCRMVLANYLSKKDEYNDELLKNFEKGRSNNG